MWYRAQRFLLDYLSVSLPLCVIISQPEDIGSRLAVMSTTKRDESYIVDVVQQSAPVDVTQPYDTASLKGKSILITGGASGFGAAFARHWASHGAHIAIGDINDAAGEELVAELRTLPGSSGHHHFRHCDVTRWEDQLALFQEAARASPTGGIDAVVANAGVLETDNVITGKGFENPSGLDLDQDPRPPPPPLRCLAVNLTGVMYTVHLALYWLPRNEEPKHGRTDSGVGDGDGDSDDRTPDTAATGTRPRDRHLLLTGSVAGIMALPGQPEYTASKHAVTGLFRSLRGTARVNQGVRVNMLCPYFVETPLIPRPGMLLLAGAGFASIGDVVDAGTRLMADEAVVGRALVIGPGLSVVDEEDGDGLGPLGGEEGGVRSRAVWECYADDYEKVDLFSQRYVRLLNQFTKLRGWAGTLKDILSLIVYRRKARA